MEKLKYFNSPGISSRCSGVDSPLAHLSQSEIAPTPYKKERAPNTPPTTQAGSAFHHVWPDMIRIKATRPIPSRCPTTIATRPRNNPLEKMLLPLFFMEPSKNQLSFKLQY